MGVAAPIAPQVLSIALQIPLVLMHIAAVIAEIAAIAVVVAAIVLQRTLIPADGGAVAGEILLVARHGCRISLLAILSKLSLVLT